MRLGILGGSFNPVHIGHIGLATFVLDNLPVLDEIWLMPCFEHGLNKKNIEYHHRFKMCELSCKGYQRIKTSDLEYEISCKNTVQLLSEFNRRYKLVTPYMIIGMDEALQINLWYNWEDLISTNRFIVVDRSGYATGKKKLWFQHAPHIYLKDEFSIIPVASSTVIRGNIKIKDKQYISSLLRPSVLKYIKDNKLYE